MAITGTPLSIVGLGDMVVLFARDSGLPKIEIWPRNIRSYSRSGIGKRTRKSQMSAPLAQRARSGGSVKKAIHGKQLFKTAHETLQICVPIAATESYVKPIVWPGFVRISLKIGILARMPL